MMSASSCSSNDSLLKDMTTLLGTMTEEQTALFQRVIQGVFTVAMQQSGVLVRDLERLKFDHSNGNVVVWLSSQLTVLVLAHRLFCGSTESRSRY